MTNIKKTPSMRAAEETLRRLFHGGTAERDCVVILDLLRYTVQENPIPAFTALPGFQSLGDKAIRRPDPNKFQGYGHAHWFKRLQSGMKFTVASEPREPWLAPFSVTMFADDDKGLLPEEVFAIRELMLGATLTITEVAIDFSLAGEVNRAFVLRHGLFGKSQRDKSNNNPAVDRWGARGSGKRTKSYEKFANASHRVESRARRSFMHAHGIDDVFDFYKFVDLLPGHHVFFAEIDKGKLVKQLNRGLSATETAQIVKQLFALKGGLTEQLAYLRQQVGLKNTRRLLKACRINKSIRRAFAAWGALWPAKPENHD